MSDGSTWQTETGLPDDFEFGIKDAAFLRSAEVKGGEQVFLALTGDTDTMGEYELRLPCGPGWDTVDGGKTIRHESGNAKKGLNNNTDYGKFIDACVKELDLGGVLGPRGEATEAKVWVGLKFHMKQREFSFPDKQNPGQEIQYYRLLPQAYLGEVGASGGGSASAPAASTPATNGASNGIEAKKLLAKVKAEAKKHDTHEAFVDAAMSIDGVADDDDLLNQVIDPDAIYATARA